MSTQKMVIFNLPNWVGKLAGSFINNQINKVLKFCLFAIYFEWIFKGNVRLGWGLVTNRVVIKFACRILPDCIIRVLKAFGIGECMIS